eukprot:2488686-Alexandrium_andersonii.AAC.1
MLAPPWRGHLQHELQPGVAACVAPPSGMRSPPKLPPGVLSAEDTSSRLRVARKKGGRAARG